MDMQELAAIIEADQETMRADDVARRAELLQCVSNAQTELAKAGRELATARSDARKDIASITSLWNELMNKGNLEVVDDPTYDHEYVTMLLGSLEMSLGNYDQVRRMYAWAVEDLRSANAAYQAYLESMQ